MTLALPTSLRLKITLAYFVIAILILGISLFTFEELKSVEEKILLGERVSELFDSALEIRRFERNFFLHRQDADFQENAHYVALLHDMLNRDSGTFALVEAPQRLATLRGELERYGELMQAYARAATAHSPLQAKLEGQVRNAGKEIVTIAEEMAATERRLVRATLSSFRHILVVVIVALALLMIAVGQALSRSVAQPLKQMERNVDAVSSGKRDKLPPPSPDRELVRITDAFNHMLHELELRQKHLLRSEKLAALGTMLAGVAHELNNPLTNIWSSCQILQEELGTADLDDQRQLLHGIDLQCERARNIVTTLLDFARDRQFNKEALALGDLLRQTVSFLKGGIPSGVTITIEIPEEQRIYADKQRMQQAFLNLIRNAVEAVGERGQVTVTSRHCNPGEAGDPLCRIEGAAIDIAIADSGPGIPAEALPRIFDPFFTTKDVGKGMGLGLFIVYQVVDEHDGCIYADNPPGGGAAFHVRLPCTANGRTAQPRQAETRNP
ncbi:MAG: HAMP domain-containing histidine kinase [Sulfuricella sp.]|nr:HAMP domain-containing histidine kinase [Sulfuricella sp.]